MPKITKRKRANTTDFKKSKNKLGKKAKSASTHTATDFKAKSIVLPEQSILQGKGSVVNKRNLSLEELLTQCSHYNPHVRKDAVFGIKDLFALHPHILSSSLAQLFDKVFDLISDEDPAVRVAVHTLFKFLLPLIPARLMEPYMNVFVVYLINGMTHINLDIRLSALKLIKLLIVHLPQLLHIYYLELLPNFLNLLGSVVLGAHSSGTPKKMGFQKHLPVLKSLYHLLRSVGAHNTLQERSASTYSANEMLILNSQSIRFFLIKASGESVPTDVMTKRSSESQLADFTKKLIPSLLKSWLECSPSDPYASVANLECMALILDIIHALFLLNARQSSLTSTPTIFCCFINDFNKYLMSHFPLSESATELNVNQARGNIRIVDHINSTLCAIISYFFDPEVTEDEKEEKGRKPAPVLPAFLQKKDDRKEHEAVLMELNSSEKRWINHLLPPVYHYVVEKLQDKNIANKSTAIDIKLLFPVAQRLLPVLSPPLQNRLMEAFHSFYVTCHMMSQSKRKCIKWIVTLLTKPASLLGGWSPNPTMAQQWIASFPQILWKLQSNNPGTTKLILAALMELCNRKCHYSENLHEHLQALNEQLVPFFFTQVSTTKTQKRASNLYGPFVLLPEAHQRLALQLIYYFHAIPLKFLKALVACSRRVSLPIFHFLVEILYHAHTKGILPLFEFSSTLLSLLVANSTNRRYEEKGAHPTEDLSSVVHDHAREKPAFADTTQHEEANAKPERFQVAEIIATNVKLWGVKEALHSMQTMVTLLLTTEVTNSETKETLLFFLGIAQQGEVGSLPPTLANQLPQAIFNYLRTEIEPTAEYSNLILEPILGLLADSAQLSAFLSLLSSKLDDTRVLHIVLLLVKSQRLRSLFSNASTLSQLNTLSAVLLRADSLTPAQHKLQVELRLLN